MKPTILIPQCHSHNIVRIFEILIEYLREIETEFANISACLSGDQMGPNHEKIKVKNVLTYTV